MAGPQKIARTKLAAPTYYLARSPRQPGRNNVGLDGIGCDDVGRDSVDCDGVHCKGVGCVDIGRNYNGHNNVGHGSVGRNDVSRDGIGRDYGRRDNGGELYGIRGRDGSPGRCWGCIFAVSVEGDILSFSVYIRGPRNSELNV